jgi:hypothetical protein
MQVVTNCVVFISCKIFCGHVEELLGSINAENFLTSCKVYWLASQEGLCSME